MRPLRDYSPAIDSLNRLYVPSRGADGGGGRVTPLNSLEKNKKVSSVSMVEKREINGRVLRDCSMYPTTEN